MSELHGIYGILVAKLDKLDFGQLLFWMISRKWMNMSVAACFGSVLACSLCEYWMLVSFKNSTIVLTPSSVIDIYCNTHSNGKCMISFISFAYTKQILAAKKMEVHIIFQIMAGARRCIWSPTPRSRSWTTRVPWHFFFSSCVTNVDTSLWESLLNTRENGMGFRVFSGSSIMFEYLQCRASMDTYSRQWYMGKSENLNTFSLWNKTGWRPVYEITFRNCQLEKSPTVQQNVSVCVFSHGS